MARSAEGLRFHMTPSKRGLEKYIEAVLTVTRTQSWKGLPGWRAAIYLGEDDRCFGTWRPTIVETVQALVDSQSHRIDAFEQERLLKHSHDMQTRRQYEAPSQDVKPSGTPADTQGTPPTHVLDHSPDDPVKIVHQIYGLFGDGKPMSALFQSGQKKWQGLAERMGAHYHLWSADDLESLVKQKYPQHWDMYKRVRFPVMRCDIGRIIILHAYGGLYADLDTEPNRSFFKQVDLALPRIQIPDKHKPKCGPTAMKKKKKKKGPAEEKTFLDMEVIVARRGNGLLLKWLDYIQKQFATKRYDKGFWRLAKMRYIYHVTGPKCMNRFLQLPENEEWLAARKLEYLECNHFKDAPGLTATDKRRFDIISHESNSYFTSATEIHVPVGSGDKSIPNILICKRVRGKHHPSQCEAVRMGSHVELAHSQGGYTQAAEADWNSLASATPIVAEAVHSDGAASDPELQQLKLHTHSLEKELAECRSREARLQKHIYDYRHCTSTKTFLADLPEDLAHFLLGK